MNIYSQCVYDADNHYVDLDLLAPQPCFENHAFVLRMRDTGGASRLETKVELILCRSDLVILIERLQEAMENMIHED